MNLNFGQALEALKAKKRVARASWGPGFYVWCDPPTLSIFAGGDRYYPLQAEINVWPEGSNRYVPTRHDLFAEDWLIVN